MRLAYLFYEPIATLAELDTAMAALKALGYEGIELSASHPLPYAPEAIRDLSERHGLPVVSLLSGWSYSHEGLCLSVPDDAIRARAVARLAEYAELAAALDAVLVVGLMQGRRVDEPDVELAHGRIGECLRRVAGRAESVGAQIVIEPVNHLQVGFHNDVASAAALAAEVGSSAVGYMLDTMHLNIEERSVTSAIEQHGAGAGHFHLCETHGGAFGTGGLDFAGVFGALREVGYDRAVSVKVYRDTDWRAAAAQAAKFLRGLGRFSAPH